MYTNNQYAAERDSRVYGRWEEGEKEQNGEIWGSKGNYVQKGILQIKEKKRESWDKFVEGINNRVSVGSLWKRIKAIMKGIEQKNKSVLSKEEKIRLEREEAEKIARLCGVSGNEVMGTIEDSLRVEREVDWANRDRNRDRYDSEFDINELERVLRLFKNKSAPGEDGIDFSIIKKLTKGRKEALIKLYNEVWVKGEVPAMWKKTKVTLIPKPQKEALRPISLLNCLGKVMERMVNERVRLWAESEEKLDKNQNGLDKGKETVAAFVDVKAAYDSVYHDVIGRILRDMRCPERMRVYVNEWLQEREVEIMQSGAKGIVEGIRKLGAKTLKYADDIVVYVVYENRKEGLKKLEEAVREIV
nr:PREDICTED: uncharacterized protein LOC105663377 [Megachile rotundata]